jgi:zinc transport system permease protein
MNEAMASIDAQGRSDIYHLLQELNQSKTIAVVSVVFYFYNDFLVMSYASEFARLRHISVRLLYFLLLAMIAVSMVIIIHVVGLILVIALLTIPPYIAAKFAGSLRTMMIIAMLISCAFAMIDLWLSYILNLTSGATIIMVAGIGFFIALFLERHKPKGA